MFKKNPHFLSTARERERQVSMLQTYSTFQ